ncbi:MAG: ABC transporter permease [Thermoanaerobaculum sp.]
MTADGAWPRVVRAVLRIAFGQLAAARRTVLLAVAGVALGVAVFIFTVALMDGLVVFFSERILRISPTLTVLPERLAATTNQETLRGFTTEQVWMLTRPPVPHERQTLRGAPALVSQLARVTGIEGVSPVATTAGILSFGTSEESATVLGLDPTLERGVTQLDRLVIQGSWDGLAQTPGGAVLGYKLAERLGVGVGDRVLLTGESGNRKELQVVAILAVGIGSWDESTVVVNLPVAQGLAGWGSDEVTEIRLRTGLDGLEALRWEVASITGRQVERWEETNRAALQLFRTIGLTTYLLTGFVLVVAGMGIANKMATMILDKERDIAVLRAYGFSRGALRGIYLSQGIALGLAGAVVGCAVALVAITYFQTFPIRFAPREGAALAYTELYLANKASYYALISAAALGISVAASLLAVRRATRVLPVEVLRGQA